MVLEPIFGLARIKRPVVFIEPDPSSVEDRFYTEGHANQFAKCRRGIE